jgi:invasion protein IalB
MISKMAGLCAFLLAMAGAATAAPAAPPAYAVKPSEVQLPPGVGLGQYRRIVQPFENWVMVCDENLAKMQKVCNVSQTIVDAQGRTVFSWTMAAVANGTPMMILRTPASVGKGKQVQLEFVGAGSGQVVLDSCDRNVCMAMMQVTNPMKKLIVEGRDVKVKYVDGSGREIAFTAPLKGLASAVNTLG